MKRLTFILSLFYISALVSNEQKEPNYSKITDSIIYGALKRGIEGKGENKFTVSDIDSVDGSGELKEIIYYFENADRYFDAPESPEDKVDLNLRIMSLLKQKLKNTLSEAEFDKKYTLDDGTQCFIRTTLFSEPAIVRCFCVTVISKEYYRRKVDQFIERLEENHPVKIEFLKKHKMQEEK